nr:hypothetical protein [Pseudonocardia sp. ICBG601]
MTRDRIASRVRRAGTAVAAVVLMGVAGCGAAAPAAPAPAPPAPSPARTGDGGLRVTPGAGGFSHVWSVGVLPDGRALVTERSGRLSLLASLDPGTAVTRSPPTSATCSPAARAG